MKQKTITVKKKSTYDPQKQYEWASEDIFSLKGIELQMLLNTLAEEITTPAGSSAVKKVDAFNILQGILIAGVEAGIIKEKL